MFPDDALVDTFPTYVLTWYPIETYVHKGQPVLLAVTTKSGTRAVGEAYFKPCERRHDDGEWWWAQESEYDNHATPVHYNCTITHWADLPLAP